MAFEEDALVLIILTLSVMISYIVEQLPLLLEDLVLEAAGQQVVLLLVEDVHLRLCASSTLQLLEEVVLTPWLLLELIQQLLGHPQASLLNGLILLEIFVLDEKRVLF